MRFDFDKNPNLLTGALAVAGLLTAAGVLAFLLMLFQLFF